VTNHDAAVRSGWKRLALAALAVVMGTALAGCETSGGLFGQSDDNGSSQIAQQPAPAPVARTRVSIAPVIGAPENVAQQLSQQLTRSLEAKQVAVAKPGEQADYTIRGYVVAAKERTNTKVSYIWDVNDPAGKRVNRVTGEEGTPSNADRDPWTAVTPALVQTIADRAATSLATNIPSAPSTTGSAPAVASAAQTAPPGQQGAGAQRTSATTTASISQPAGVVAVVPSVSGAPGDGSQSLAAAMQKELTRNGIQLAPGPSATAYKVEGKVQMGQGRSGTQPIQIEWQVKDPKGNKLGTVSQKNEIPQGSLDGPWGQTAEVAAAAAAQGVIKLLPQTQTN